MNTIIRNSLLFFSLLLFSKTTLKAQEYYNPDALRTLNEKKIYVGIASGIESFAGMLGASLEGNVAKRISLFAGAGLGGWGYKLSGGVKLYKQFPYKWAYCASLSHATGLKDFKTKLETQTGSKDVLMDLLSCQTFNITAQHHWKIGQGSNRFNIEFGLSIPIKDNVYVIKDGSVLTRESASVMTVLQPGGLTVGIGFTFGK